MKCKTSRQNHSSPHGTQLPVSDSAQPSEFGCQIGNNRDENDIMLIAGRTYTLYGGPGPPCCRGNFFSFVTIANHTGWRRV
jgi:hypothetical protein